MKFTLRPHQLHAADAAFDALSGATSTHPSAATVVMATGSGKTAVGWAVAERLGCRTLVVAAPTRTLVEQLAADVRHHDVGVPLLVASLEVPDATLDHEVIGRHLAGAGVRVVVVTYRSLPVVAHVLRSVGRHADLLIADEAHHTCGPTAGAAASAHGFPAAARLYMTATPRIYGGGDDSFDGSSMDDVSIFGERVVDLDLAEAIERGIVSDYRVVVAVVDHAALKKVERLAPESDVHLLAGAVATVRSMKEWDVRSLLSFHSRVSRSRTFAALVGAVARELPVGERPGGPGFAAWVSGRTPDVERRRVLDRLTRRDGWAVVASARCLSEGVDVPAVGGIAICDPKTSGVDVAQAIGRALRPSAGKVATVVLPVVLSDDGLDRDGLSIAGTVLRVLRGHDRSLGRRMDEARVELGRTGSVTSLDDRVALAVPPGVTGELVARLRLELVREATAGFDEMLGLLHKWVEVNGHAGVPQQAIVDGFDGRPRQLGSWCTTQRMLYRRGQLPMEREAALEVLPGWQWTPLDDRFAAQVAALELYVAEHGVLPTLKTVYRGVKIGQFVNVVRTAYVNGKLDAARVEVLEQVPGWLWNHREKLWDDKFAELVVYTERCGVARPSAVGGDRDLGRWVAKQRAAFKDGRLDPERAARLERLAGWVWNERDAAWENMFASLQRWVVLHGSAAPVQGQMFDGVAVGAWVAKQRARFHAGRLDRERATRLERLAGWVWTPKDVVWEDRMGELEQFTVAFGHPHVPDDGVHASLASWVYLQRVQFRRGVLAADRVVRLQALPGWVWDGRVARRLRADLRAD